ncbi:DUF2946 domain-containing protein [Caballeronia glathei]|nr:DUF2946 domain-containing protein [Caballeronia glathei]
MTDAHHGARAIAPCLRRAYNRRLPVAFAFGYMTRTSRNRFVAWLGIAAMWLAIVAPVVSQTIAARVAAADPQAPMCSADFVPGIAPAAPLASSAEHGDHHQAASADTDTHGAHHASAADHFDACSYCGLLAHHVPLLAGALPGVARIERSARVAYAPALAAVHAKSFNAARPRAPPVVS